ncbi:sensor histidine kinase [Streptococcus infantarius]|uniref:sensor histidine kinase n=1 Tax=Streptococcus infantarius TaxID=102684 RepID=UPI0022E5F9B0|nr:sensor histidine kinase [Streptococcus infantarius]
MIRQFFKEFGVWYLTYTILTTLFLTTFILFHLPIAYFKVSFSVNITILIFITIWQYYKFKRKQLILQQFIYVKELNDFHLPSEQAFRAIICQQKETHASELLKLQTQMKNIQNLIKMWSHQMKVPLSALSLMAQTDQLDPKEVEQQLNRLQNYLDTLLNYLKFSQNKDDFRFEKLFVKNIATSIIKKYRIPCLLKHLSVEVTGDWELNSDRKWVNFALTQLIDNAIKYSKEGGKIAIRISQSSIEISDDGIGILEEDLPRIFEEGFTGFNGHEHQKATGLGLYMTKQVLDSLNLDITIHSQIDQGTQVFITPKKR